VNRILDRLGPVRAYRELRHDYDHAIFVLAAGDLVASFGFSLVFPFLTIFLTSNLGASAAEAGLVLGAYSVCSIFSYAAGGWLADRFGRKIVMTVSITLTAIVVALMGQVSDLRAVGALTMVLGLVDPPFIPAARAAVADVVPEERRPRAYSLLTVAASVGWIAGPAIGAGLAVLGYSFLFFVSGVILAGYTFILIFGFQETKPKTDAAAIRAAGGRPTGSDEGRRATEVPIDPDALYAGLGQAPRARVTLDAADPALARRIFLAFLPICVVIHAVSFQWVATLPIHANRDLGVSTTTWGLLFAFNGILIVLFQLRVTSSTERLLKPRAMALGLVAYGLAYLAIAPVVGPEGAVPALALVVILATVGEMLVYPYEASFVADLSPVAARGRYQGMLGAAVGLGSAVGPPVGGLMLDLAPGAPTWIAVSTAAAVAAGGLWLLSSPVRRLLARQEATAAEVPA
jgi:MFS family permease